MDKLKIQRQLLNLGVPYLRFVFMAPHQRRISYFVAVIMTLTRVLLMIFALMLLPQAKSLMVVTDVIAAASGFMQGMKALIPIILYKDEFLYLLGKVDSFWPAEEELLITETYYKRSLRLITFYFRLISVTYVVYVPVALILMKLPFKTWVPDATYGFWMMYAFQFVQLTFDTFTVIAADTFFMGACFNIYGQWSMLNRKMEILGRKGVRNLRNDIIKCINHHNFLFEYTNVLIKVFSIGLIFQFFVTTYSICIEIFVFTRRDLVGMCISTIYCSMLTSQLALYCFPADTVTEISYQTAISIYSSNWYAQHKDFRPYVQNIVQRAQKRIKFTAGGLINIDKEAFTKIFRGILSLNAVMKDVIEV